MTEPEDAQERRFSMLGRDEQDRELRSMKRQLERYGTIAMGFPINKPIPITSTKNVFVDEKLRMSFSWTPDVTLSNVEQRFLATIIEKVGKEHDRRNA